MLTLEDIFNRFKTQLNAGDKLKEIISTTDKQGQVRVEDGNFLIQLRWEQKNNVENKMVSFKQKLDTDWNRIPLNNIKNGDKDKIDTQFNEIKTKIINKNNEVINNGMQGDKENNKENKEIIKSIIEDDIKTHKEVIKTIEQNINEEPEIIQKEIDKIDTVIKKHKGRPKKVVK
jgi:hypothetical protein